MSDFLHACLYNTDPRASAELTGAIAGLNFVRITSEVASPDELSDALQQGGINLVFFHLDPEPDPVIEVIEQVSTRHPEVALIAVSHQTEPTAILAPMRAGCDQFVCEPIDAEDLAAAVGRVASKRLMAQPKSRCICVTGASGGAGATSIACNLALEIGQLTDRECALVDLDFAFGDVALNFDCDPKYTVHDLAVAGGDLDEAILTSTLTKIPPNVALLARPKQIESVTGGPTITSDTVHRVIELLMAGFENIVLDVPRDLNASSATALELADKILIVCQLLVPSIRNARRYLDVLAARGIPPERIEVLVNRSDGRSGRITVKDIEQMIGRPVYACVPNDYQYVARSIDFGRPIATLDRNSPVRAAIRSVARKIISTSDGEGAQQRHRRGFLSRLLTK